MSRAKAPSEYAIDRGVPLPPRRQRSPRSIYPWNEMEIGDSFFVPDRTMSNFSGNIASAQRSTSRKFTIRNWTEKKRSGRDQVGVRVWRTA